MRETQTGQSSVTPKPNPSLTTSSSTQTTTSVQAQTVASTMASQPVDITPANEAEQMPCNGQTKETSMLQQM